jgi:hypothetical protein
MKVWLAEYCPNPESDYGVISVHSTKQGAHNARNEHRRSIKMAHDDTYKEFEALKMPIRKPPYDEWRSWRTREVEIQETTKHEGI